MKRLTKDERTGATAIALVALLVCGGSILFKHLGKRPHASPEMVKSIILASDSASGKKNEGPITEIKKEKRKKRMSEGKDTVGAKTKRNKNKDQKEGKKPKKKTAPSRDYLSEPL